MNCQLNPFNPFNPFNQILREDWGNETSPMCRNNCPEDNLLQFLIIAFIIIIVVLSTIRK